MTGNWVLHLGKGGKDGVEVRNSRHSQTESQDLQIKQLWEGEDKTSRRIR